MGKCDERGQIGYHAVMKLNEYAHRVGVNYKIAWRWWRTGTPDAYQTASGTVIVREPAETTARVPAHHHVVIYACVSAAEHRSNLESQAERLVAYCAAKGYHVHQVVQEIGSSVNDSRPRFLTLLADPMVETLDGSSGDGGR
jgi:predicted site-specific integrase-resolvase